MSDAPRGLAFGVFLALMTVAALRLFDLGYALVSFVLFRVDVLPSSSMTTSAAILIALALAALGAKAWLLFTLVLRPDRLGWAARSWTWPIVITVLALVAMPATTALRTLQAIEVTRYDFVADEVSRWFVVNSYVGVGTQWASAAMWSALVLVAFARVRSIMTQPA